MGVQARNLKRCTRCGVEKHHAEFYKRNRKPIAACIPCTRVSNNLSSGKNKKDTERFRKFGITPADFAALLEAHEHKCAICGTADNGTYLGKPRAMAVDHSHVTGQLRGILCSRCNSGLGLFSDSVEVLTGAIEYLNLYTKGNDVV